MADDDGERVEKKSGQRLTLEGIDAEVLLCAIEGRNRLNCRNQSVNADVLNALALEKYEKLDLDDGEIEKLRVAIEAHGEDCSERPVDGQAFAQTLRRLASATDTPLISPKGIRLDHANIIGKLDLEDCAVKFPLSFYDCEFGMPDQLEPSVVVKDATVQSLVFRRCTIHGGINARRLRTSGNLRLQGCRVFGTLSLMGARIGRNLELGRDIGEGEGRQSVFEGRAGAPYVIQADRMEVGSSFIMRNIIANGRTRLVGAKISGKLDADEALLNNPGGVALDAYRIEVDGDFMLQKTVINGQIILRGARIGGDLEGQKCQISNIGGIAIYADRIEVKNDLRLGCGAIIKGVVRCPGAHIGGQMHFNGSQLDATGDHFVALFARGAKIGGSVYLTDYKPSKETPPQRFMAWGEINFNSAQIGDRLIITGGKLHCRPSEQYSTALGKDMEADDDNIQENENTALSLVNARIGHLIMPRLRENRPEGIINMARAKVGIFEDYAAAWPEKTSNTYLVLDGFSYDHLKFPDGNIADNHPDTPAKQRIKWLNSQSAADLGKEFKPAPWMQLARVLKAQGHIKNAQDVLIERKRRRSRNYPLFSPRRLQDRVLYSTARYGFRPWRAVMAMVLSILLYAGLWHIYVRDCDERCWQRQDLFVRGAVDEFDNKNSTAHGDPYPPFNSIMYSLDTFIPLFEFKYEHAWMVRTTYCPLNVKLFAKIIEHRSIVKGCALASPKQPQGTANIPSSAASWKSMGTLFYLLYILEVLLGIVLTSIAVTGFAGYLGRID